MSTEKVKKLIVEAFQEYQKLSEKEKEEVDKYMDSFKEE